MMDKIKSTSGSSPEVHENKEKKKTKRTLGKILCKFKLSKAVKKDWLGGFE